jgi:hypothetical protein
MLRARMTRHFASPQHCALQSKMAIRLRFVKTPENALYTDQIGVIPYAFS